MRKILDIQLSSTKKNLKIFRRRQNENNCYNVLEEGKMKTIATMFVTR